MSKMGIPVVWPLFFFYTLYIIDFFGHILKNRKTAGDKLIFKSTNSYIIIYMFVPYKFYGKVNIRSC